MHMQNSIRFATSLTLCLASLTPPALAQRAGRYTLNPKTYRSSSGEFELRVDPSTIYGQGEGAYRLTHNGVETWHKKLPFTLWDAGLTDSGVTAGYAYSLGKENCPLAPLRPDQSFDSVVGQLHLVIIDPAGSIRLDESFDRKGMQSCMSGIDRTVTGFILDAGNDRFVVRASEGTNYIILDEIWRTFRLSNGKNAGQFNFAHAIKSTHESWSLLDARAVTGTPLILVNWHYSKHGATGNKTTADGACFNLVDPSGKQVWELDWPNDYPDAPDNDYTPAARRKLNLDMYIQEHGAILRTDQPREFEIWSVSAGKRVKFKVTQEAGLKKRWTAMEVERSDYAGPVSDEPALVTLPQIELEHVGTVRLDLSGAATPVIRDIRRFAIDPRGRIGFVRAENDAPNTFVLIDGSGTVVSEVTLPEVLRNVPSFNPLACIEDLRWIVAADRPTKDALATAWWVDADRKVVSPIDSFKYRVGQVVRLGHGKLVLIDEQEFGKGRLVCLDEKNEVAWVANGLGHCNDLTVTSDGKLAVVSGLSDVLLFDENGRRVGSINARKLQGSGGVSVQGLAAEKDGGFVVQACFDSPRFHRIGIDGHEKASFDPRFQDGRVINLPGMFGTDVQVDPNGRLWVSDGAAFFRLNDDGIVDKTLGETPDSPVLRTAGVVAVDSKGSIYVSDQRNCFVHVFDSSGKRLFVCRPKPDDFNGPYEWGPLTVAGDGTIYLRDVRFSGQGNRLGKPGWPGHFVSGTQVSWAIHDENVVLHDAERRAAVKISRRPNGEWLNHIKAHAIAPDGSLALLTDAFDIERRGDPSFHFYSPQGAPLKSIPGPNIENGRLLGDELIFNGRFLVARAVDKLLIADVSSDPPKWSLAAPKLRDIDWWKFLLAPNGKELWLFSLKENVIERFELPGLP